MEAAKANKVGASYKIHAKPSVSDPHFPYAEVGIFTNFSAQSNQVNKICLSLRSLDFLEMLKDDSTKLK